MESPTCCLVGITSLRNIRLIARLDVKAPNLVKGVQFEGLRKLGSPKDFALKYYSQGVDEIYFEDIVASLYERNSLVGVIEETSEDIFVPITVGGGLRTIEDVVMVLHAGADKVAINTAAIKNPKIITRVAEKFGRQCMVLSVQAKKQENGWEAYFDNGRERSGLDVVEWVKKGVELGAGEIVLTSVDREGTGHGFDVELLKAVVSQVEVPVIASGGMGTLSHLEEAVLNGGVDAIAMARVLHYNVYHLSRVRAHCVDREIPVRNLV